MDVVLSPDQEKRLDQLAARAGLPKHELVREAIGSYLDYENWVSDTRAKIDEGYAQAQQGDLIDGEEAKRRLRNSHEAFLQRDT